MMTYNELSKQLKKLLEQKCPGVDYNQVIADKFNIDRSSVLRKWRGDTKFTATEVFEVAKEFSLSLDQIYAEDYSQCPVELYNYDTPEKFSWDTIYKLVNIYEQTRLSENSNCMIVTNAVPILCWAQSECLSKLMYLVWVHKNKHGNKDLPDFAEIGNNKKYKSIIARILESMKDMKSSTYILSDRLMKDIAESTLYFYKTKNITNDEVKYIMEDLHKTIDYLETLSYSGHFPDTKNTVNLYTACKPVTIDLNILESTNINLGIIYAMQLYPIINKTPDSYHVLKEWYYSMMPSSVQITLSNEGERNEYFSGQRHIIDSILGTV